MLDPRIYRTGLVAVALALIVFAFSLQDQPSALTSNLAPQSFSGPNAYATMTSLAGQFPARQPGSAGDRGVADYVARRLRGYGYAVARTNFAARTALGARTLQTVTGTLAGNSTSALLIVAHRDATTTPATSDLSGTAVLLELARVLAAGTEHHTIVLASVSGSTSAVGATQLARALPEPVDAVLVLGDLASPRAHPPLVVPWSRGQTVAPLVLRNTVATALAAQGQRARGGDGLAAQLLHQAFPVSLTEQAPFNQVGVPSVLVSRTGDVPGRTDALGRSGQAADEGAIASMGQGMLQSIDALDAGPDVPGPASYLVFGGKLIPAWSIRLLVLALILPVAMATLDALARVRRRGHPLLTWIAAALASAAGFLLAALAVVLARVVGLLSSAPGGPVPAGAAPPHAMGVATIAIAAVALVAGLVVLRPRLAALAGGAPRTGGQPGAVAVLLVLCAATLGIWAIDPIAALVIVPALHLWMWLGVDTHWARPLKLVLWLLGLVLPGLTIAYYALSQHLGPFDVLWNGVLMIAGGQLGTAAIVLWSVVFGCFASVLALAWRPAPQERSEPVRITMRGPLSYAGPGSLGGTESALRR